MYTYKEDVLKIHIIKMWLYNHNQFFKFWFETTQGGTHNVLWIVLQSLWKLHCLDLPVESIPQPGQFPANKKTQHTPWH